MKRYLLSCLLVFAGALLLYAQPVNRSTYETMLKAAEEKMAENDYYNALDQYEKCFDDKKEKPIAYKIANIHLLLRDYANAEKWFGKLTRSRKNEFPDARFYLGKAMKQNGKYQEAMEELQQFISETMDPALKAQAEVELEGAKMGLKMKDPENLKVENAGQSVNTPFTEYSPAMLNANDMYFASFQRDNIIKIDGKEGNYHSRILSITRSGNGWSKADVLNKEINREGFHTGNPTFSSDKKRMYFTRAKLTGNIVTESEIYVSEWRDGDWAPPSKVAGVNGTFIAKHPCIGELFGKEVLFFSANMEGGKGGFDLYYATRKPDGGFEIPVNLGPSVNTAGDEVTPFYTEGKLFFSSNGWPTIGGYDIFTSTWNGSNWSKVQNMGKGYNSPADDLYFSCDKLQENGLLVSNRIAPGSKSLKSKTCCDDIYTFMIEKPVIDFNVVSLEKGKPLNGVTVQLIEMTGGKPGETSSKKSDGNKTNFKVTMDKGFMVITTKDGYVPDTLQFNTTNIKKSTAIEKKVNLRTVPKKKPEPKEEEVVVEINQPIRLNNIYYDYDDDKILPDAEADLNYLDTLMVKYPDMVIELSSHTDSRGNDDYNMKLSQRRADSAKRYLVGKGIAEKRIKAVGYGESQLLNECKNGVKCSDAEHRLNRRTEFKIISGPTSIIIKKIEKRKRTGDEGENKGGEVKKDKGGPRTGDAGDSVKPKNAKVSLVSFEKKFVDFGPVRKGEKRHHVYTFTNTSQESVEIDMVTACECTKTDWTRGPIKPGARGEIIADFDSTEKDKGEDIIITIILKNTDPVMHYPIVEEVKFRFDLVK